MLGKMATPSSLAFKVDAVEAAFFAQDDLGWAWDEVGRVGFDGFGDVELGGYGAAFAHEEIFADQGLPRGKGVTAGAADDFGDFAALARFRATGTS